MLSLKQSIFNKTKPLIKNICTLGKSFEIAITYWLKFLTDPGEHTPPFNAQ